MSLLAVMSKHLLQDSELFYMSTFDRSDKHAAERWYYWKVKTEKKRIFKPDLLETAFIFVPKYVYFVFKKVF